MGIKKEEYQPLEGPQYTIIQKPTTRLILCTLFVVQLILLTIWVFTLLDKFRNNQSIKVESLNPIFVDGNLLKEDYNELEVKNPVCDVANDDEKFDCYPEKGGTLESCQERLCCWEEKKSKVEVPSCFYPKNYGGYKFLNSTYTKTGLKAFITRTFPSPYPDDVKIVRIDVKYISDTIVQVKMLDPTTRRYEPPLPKIPVMKKLFKRAKYKVKLGHEGLKIIRNDGNVLLDCQNVGGFIFADQFLQISMKYSGKIYGLGEHQTSLQLNANWTKFTFFARDGIPKPETNLYGSHPFYLVMETHGSSHGVFFHNSNAMDVILQPLPAITFRAIGGIFNFYIFLGPTPADVIKQFTEIIGRPFLPPYWSLGFHLSRLGYKNTSDIRDVWERTRAAKIPFDTQWHDIDYMNKRNDFTYDRKHYSDLPEFVKEVHRVGMHYIPIVDPGISGCEPNNTYPPYDDGVKMNVFVRNADGSLFHGKVWNPKCTVFPDFTAENSFEWWSKHIREFHNSIPFDGIWIDMNEPSNFLNGSFDGCPQTKYDDPPYLPNVAGGKLYSLTLCMSCRHEAGLHYDLHNLYGLSEAIATYSALRTIGMRPFIISRSTYPGSGKYAGHWSGDVTSTWESMKATIPKMLSFSLFGIPMMGADICGFNGNTTATLCQRWTQLGAFYPFSRNHNSDDCIDQDPVALGEDVVKSAVKALMGRYALLPYLYTLFYKAHTEGETVARPLFFEFWYDRRTHNIDNSFLWGCCLLIVPVLEEHATTVKTYLPAGRWYDWYTGLGMESPGSDVNLPAPSDTIPGFIRGGAIISTQTPAVTTTQSRMNNITLFAAYNTTLNAYGTLYWDDGVSVDPINSGYYGSVIFKLSSLNLVGIVKHWGPVKPPLMDKISILGFVKPISHVYFNKKEIDFNWNSTTLILTVKVEHSLNLPFELEWK